MNMFTTPDSLRTVCTVELPGLKIPEVSVTLQNLYLIIHGVRRPPPATNYSQMLVSELKFGIFIRIIRIPAGTQQESIGAIMDDGMLTLSWPSAAHPIMPADSETWNRVVLQEPLVIR